MFSLFILLLLPLLPLHALQLNHRLLHPSAPQSPFFPRASILPDAAGNPRIEPVPSVQADFEAFATFETSHATDALYQLAIDLQGDSPWLISSVKACHLVNTANEHLVLHVPYPGGTPFAIDYFLDSAPSHGKCPRGWASSPTLALPQNLTITVSIPNRPPLPQLRVPPPLTTTGDPVVQEPEKSFLQKYWLYIVLALGVLMITPGGEEGARG
ncbi:hypothetical protein DFH94DRAFT_716929 [Russula ochroleuca]|uniref:ER membrane protein complex subunit 10 n=1 Tax=Russula ochroleuca TaxID=152965 RepID=A0A9P5N2J1_9AGAM|nr:hypothetical protein DFH94DRAFT_716929 [Russula ochroleuca]